MKVSVCLQNYLPVYFLSIAEHPPPFGAARRRGGGSTVVPDALDELERNLPQFNYSPPFSSKAMCCLESNALYLILHDIFQLS